VLAGYRQAGLLFRDHPDNGFLVTIHETRRIEVGRLALKDPLGQLEHEPNARKRHAPSK
jgi:hypothetical protein